MCQHDSCFRLATPGSRQTRLTTPGFFIVMLMSLIVAAALIPAASATLFAQGTTAARWQADYWDNTTLAGPPLLSRTESTPNHDWGRGAPTGVAVPADRFSARWQTTIELPAGRYEFAVTGDDGVRLWVDGEQLIDEWTVQSAQRFVATTTLPGGAVPIRLDYFENTGIAFVALTWQQLTPAEPTPAPTPLPTNDSAVGAPLNLWQGEYFHDMELRELAFERKERELSFDWGIGSPDLNELAADTFSARWTRTLTLDPGAYEFVVTSDDGARVWVDEELVIDQWTIQAARRVAAVVDVVGGTTPVRVEYFENSGLASIELRWQPVVSEQVDTPVPIVPDEAMTQPTATMTGARYLNVRTGPGIQYARVTVIPNGTVVELIGRTGSGPWVRIQLGDGTRGWVNSRYLTSATSIVELPILA